MLALLLLALWLAMSGIYKPLLLTLGVISVLISVLIVRRLDLLSVDNQGVTFSFVRLMRYLFWLTVEVGKADWAVTKVILAPTLPERQRLIAVPARQRTEFAKMLFANSITLTPGTVTVETESDCMIVHALTDEAADMTALDDMGSRVCALEKVPA